MVPRGPEWINNLNFPEDILIHLLVPILNIINDTENKKWYIKFLYNTFTQYNIPQQIQFMQAINKYLYYYTNYDELTNIELSVQNILKKIVYTYYTNIPKEFSTVFEPVLIAPNNNTYPKFLTNNTVDGYPSHDPDPLY